MASHGKHRLEEFSILKLNFVGLVLPPLSFPAIAFLLFPRATQCEASSHPTTARTCIKSCAGLNCTRRGQMLLPNQASLQASLHPAPNHHQTAGVRRKELEATHLLSPLPTTISKKSSLVS